MKNKIILTLASLLIATGLQAQTQNITPNILGGQVFSYQGQTFFVSTNGGSLQVLTQGVQGTNVITVPASPQQAMEVATAWINANNPANSSFYGTNEIEARLFAGYIQNSGQAVAGLSVEKWGVLKSMPNIGAEVGVLQGNNAGKSGTAGAFAGIDYRKVIGDVAAVGGIMGGYDNWNERAFVGAKVGVERRQSAHLGEFVDCAYCLEQNVPGNRGLLIFAGISYAF